MCEAFAITGDNTECINVQDVQNVQEVGVTPPLFIFDSVVVTVECLMADG
jgi:hypothetical protein